MIYKDLVQSIGLRPAGGPIQQLHQMDDGLAGYGAQMVHAAHIGRGDDGGHFFEDIVCGNYAIYVYKISPKGVCLVRFVILMRNSNSQFFCFSPFTGGLLNLNLCVKSQW